MTTTNRMNKTIRFSSCIALNLALCFASATHAALPQGSTNGALPDLIERVLPSVVNLSATTVSSAPQSIESYLQFWGIPQERKHTSQGSGFLIDNDGYVLTNSHVVTGAREVLVTLHDKQTYRAKIVGMDDKYDVALVQIRDKSGKTPAGLKPVTLGNSDVVRIGEGVIAVGNPFGLASTVTTGIISAKNRTIGQGPFDNFLQTDASINPGNSGGPLFSATNGAVLGINTVIFSRVGQSSGVGFAIPINEAMSLVPDLKRYGRVPRPWLGLLAERMTPVIQEYYQLGTDSGVLVYNLVRGGPAERSGLKQGDILIEVSGQKVIEVADVERLLAKQRPTDTITIVYLRGNARRTQKLKLQELPRISNLPPGII